MTAYSNTKNDKSYTNAGQQDPMGKEGHMQYPPKTYHPAEPGCNGDDTICATLPDLKRLNYFYGQMLGVADFQAEQAYFREKLKLHNRCLHGYGVVCGLLVSVVPPLKDCPPEYEKDDDDDVDDRIDELKEKLAQITDAESEEYTNLLRQIRRLERERELGGRMSHASARPLLSIAPGLALDCEGNELVVREPLRFDPWKLLEPSDRRRLEDCEDEETLWI